MGELYRSRILGDELRIGERRQVNAIRLRGADIAETVADDVDLTTAGDTLVKALKWNGSLPYQGVDFSGTVVDGDGNPVAGAIVYLFGADDADGNPILIDQTVSDASGDYLFEDIPLYDFDFAAPEATVVAAITGYTTGSATIAGIVDGVDETNEDVVVIEDVCVDVYAS